MLIFQHKSTLWMECLKLVNVLISTFLGSKYHTECLVVKMKKNSAPVPTFYRAATGSTGIFLGLNIWFPIGSQLEPTIYLARLLRYEA